MDRKIWVSSSKNQDMQPMYYKIVGFTRVNILLRYIHSGFTLHFGFRRSLAVCDLGMEFYTFFPHCLRCFRCYCLAISSASSWQHIARAQHHRHGFPGYTSTRIFRNGQMRCRSFTIEWNIRKGRYWMCGRYSQQGFIGERENDRFGNYRRNWLLQVIFFRLRIRKSFLLPIIFVLQWFISSVSFARSFQLRFRVWEGWFENFCCDGSW